MSDQYMLDGHAPTLQMFSDKAFRHACVACANAYFLARQIRDMRAARGWTQRELAQTAGLNVMTIWRYERSCRHAQLQKLCAIARAFDCAFVVRFVAWSEFIVIMGKGAFLVPLSFGEENLRVDPLPVLQEEP